MFRAYHVPNLQRLTNADGEKTGAIYGVMNMIRKLLKEYNPDYFAVVFDAKGKTFRNDMYPDYKAHRPPIPEDLVSQITPIHELIKAMGLPLLVIDGVEADDVIGTLAKNAETKKIDTIISTGDKDLAQLVNPHINLINTMDNVLLDVDGVKQKFGVPPELIIDYLALIGDSVDNVPGIPKVGPKTAVKWLTEYGSLDSIIANADQIKGKVGENLRSNIQQLALSRELVTLKCDVHLDTSPDKLVPSEPDREQLHEQYSRWQFRSWLSEINDVKKDSITEKTAGEKCEYETITTQPQLDTWLKQLKSADLFAFDTETTSLNYMEAEVVGMSFAVTTRRAAYLPLAHDYVGAPRQLSRDKVLKQFKPLLEDSKPQKLGHNLKYDKNVLANHGICLNGIQHDTMLQSYVADSTATRHDMDSLALKYLDTTTIHYEDVAGKGVKQIPFNQVPVEQASPYAAEDAEITLRLHHFFLKKLGDNKNLLTLYNDIEIPLLSVLSKMERNGVIIDAEMLGQHSKDLSRRLQKIEQEIFSMAGEEFNIGSPKQIQAILYDKLELPVLAKTPKGQPSTSESVLQELAHDYELPMLILEHRSLSKLKSTYTDKLPEQINRRTGRIHTSYHQAVAATGRLSSSDPNLQNIPIRTEEGRRIRRAFIAPPGYKLVAADYSQIELRIMAHLSRDPSLMSAFAKGEDIHKITAAEIFSTDPSRINNDQRRAAKAINFGLIYGMSPFGLSKQLDIEISEAKVYVDRYFERYPGVKEFMDKTRITAREKGYVETIFNRRLYLPDINSRNAARRQYAERTAINAPMQGTAADIIKRAMLTIDKWLTKKQVNARLIMQVHDELVFEIAEADTEIASDEITKLMVGAAELSVPLLVDIGTGYNWDEAH